MAIFDPPNLENRSTDFDETGNLERRALGLHLKLAADRFK